MNRRRAFEVLAKGSPQAEQAIQRIMGWNKKLTAKTNGVMLGISEPHARHFAEKYNLQYKVNRYEKSRENTRNIGETQDSLV